MKQLDRTEIFEDVKRTLQEDIGGGDVTSLLIPEDLTVKAHILTREPMLMCGQPWVQGCFFALDPHVKITWLVKEGEWVDEPQPICELEGHARAILTAERTALNWLQTLSGTATQTYHFLQEIKHTNTQLLDTRKTFPGLRRVQKYAVTCAGAKNHRFGLYDAILIKENHIHACGSIGAAIQKARELAHGLLLEVEVETLEELKIALDAAPDRILLDNFDESMMQKAVALNQPRRCSLGVSGGVNLHTIRKIAETGVDYIAVGAMTKSVQAIDLSLLIY